MKRKITLASLICLLCIAFVSQPVVRCAPHPLSKSELLALVAGDILPENVVFDIQSRGLDFVPDASYKALLKSAGASAKVLAALNTAKIGSAGSTDSSADAQLLEHLSHAGSLIKSGKLDDAADELTDALSNSSHKSEIGFVIGMVLIAQHRVPEAGAVYSQILSEDPGLPEVHARLSLTYYNTGDAEEALRQAKAALEENPNNPVAHLNAGASLQLMQRFDAAKEEYQKSIRCKPDYVLAYVDLGSLFDHVNDFDAAIDNFKKALVLNPDDVQARYELGVVYGEQGNFVAAIREYREVKRRDPKMLEARQNLGAALIHTDPGAAITEFRELAAIAPDWPFCHQCLASALFRTGRLPEAEKEYRLAIQQNPASTGPLNGLGLVYETEKKAR
jgi:tetratricopeptide (TPR) repeat protein